MATHLIATLPGDGIGPEIMEPTLELLEALGDFEFEEHLFGGASIDVHGVALTDEVLADCRRSDAVLLAAVGGPKWDTTDPDKPRPEQGLLGLRKGLGLYANLRPVKPLPALYDASPLRRERIEGTDLLVVRELTGGIYFGEKTRTATSASDVCAYTTEEIERIARTAFTAAERDRQPKVSSVDKANVLETSRLWREVVSDLHAREFPRRRARARARRQRRHAARLSAAATSTRSSPRTCSATSSPMRPPCSRARSACSRARRSAGDGPGMFEPVHGSAPDIAGKGRRQPAGHVPLGRDDAPPRARLGKRGGGCRIGC